VKPSFGEENCTRAEPAPVLSSCRCRTWPGL